jgi:hypothetical protein
VLCSNICAVSARCYVQTTPHIAACSVSSAAPASQLLAHLLANGEWQVLVLDHVLDLALHGDDKQQDPVHEQDGPEDGDVKHLEQRHAQPHSNRLDAGPPAQHQGKGARPTSSMRVKHRDTACSACGWVAAFPHTQWERAGRRALDDVAEIACVERVRAAWGGALCCTARAMPAAPTALYQYLPLPASPPAFATTACNAHIPSTCCSATVTHRCHWSHAS